MNNIKYSIAKDFTRKPGPRYKWQGSHSGEQFLEEVLLNLFEKSVNESKKLVINLDHTYGYGPSFLEESFGGLARLRDKKLVKAHISFISEEEPFLIDEINEYIADAVPES